MGMLQPDELKDQREQLMAWIAIADDAIQSAIANGRQVKKLESKRLQMVQQLEKVTDQLEKLESRYKF